MQPGSSVSGMHDCAVIIIGGGPCGLVLAIELGRRGVSTIVLEEKTSPARFPAANATQFVAVPTCAGSERLVDVPSPSAPKLLLPHAQSVPSLFSATV